MKHFIAIMCLSLFTLPFFGRRQTLLPIVVLELRLEQLSVVTYAAVALCLVCEIFCVQDLPALTWNITSSRPQGHVGVERVSNCIVAHLAREPMG